MKDINVRVFWLALPCSALAAFPALKAQVFPPFEPVVDEVHVVSDGNNTNDPDIKSYSLTIYVAHKGARPEWWGKREGISSSSGFPGGSYIHSTGLGPQNLLRPRFVDARGRTQGWRSWGATFNLYDAASQRYVIHCQPDVSQDLRIDGARLTADIPTQHGLLRVDKPIKISPPLR